MLADIFMDLLYIVGIAFLGLIFIATILSALNEIRLSKAKKDFINVTLGTAFKAISDKEQKKEDKKNK